MGARFAIVVGLAFGMLPCAAGAQEEKQPSVRPYAAGPLTSEDFQAKIPEQIPDRNGINLLAYTLTDIYYNYKYQYRQQGGVVTAWASEVTFTAQVLRDESWNRAPQNLTLLAHEQGHFDITEIFTWRCQQAFDKLVAQKAINGRGATEEEAREAMVAELRKQREPFLNAWRDEHLRYDKETNHGQDRARQRGWRKKLGEQLALVARERAAAQPPGKARNPR